MSAASPLIIRCWGIEDYGEIFQLMKTFTNQRSNLTSDEIWMVQHNPVFTQGQAGKDEYILGSGDIPCLLYTSPSPRDLSTSRMPSSA